MRTLLLIIRIRSAHPYLPFWIKFFLFILFNTAVLFSQGQLCTGSLGDPAVNITFDGGASTYARNYQYVGINCPNDGSYTVTNATSGCFGNTWHTLSSDHTGNGGGFMLVNASFEPGDFYVDTIQGLCPNTTYEFAAWIVNVLNRSGIRPNITFRVEKVDGTVLGTYETGDIDNTGSAVWKQYGFYFATPLNEALIVLRMTNNAPGGLGNDLALDDITFRPCGSKVEAEILNNTDTVHICEGDRSVFNMQAELSADYVNPVYLWQLSRDRGRTWDDMPGAADLSYQRLPTDTGIYWYRLAVTEADAAGIKACRIASNALVIHVHPNPSVAAGPDRVLIKGNSVVLDGQATGEEIKFTWTPEIAVDNAGLQKPTVSPQADIEYTLAAVSRYGCPNADKVNVKVVNDIFVPNAFTPNGDGKNDVWRIPFLDPSLNGEVYLFNRYGQLVYRAAGEIIAWDGMINKKPQPAGVYVYLVKVGNRRFTGTVALIR